MVRYLTAKQLLRIHYLMMEQYGESEQAGILFEHRFYAAVERPQMVVFGEEIHPTIWQKAGAFVQALVQDHPFHNGNKCTAFAALVLFLTINGYQLKLSDEQAVELMVQIAKDSVFKGDKGAGRIGEMIRSVSVERE